MKASGFTLIETLVALFVFAMLATAGALLLGNSVEAAQRIETASAETGALQRTRAALAADLAQIAPRPSRARDGTLRPAIAAGSEAGLGANGALFAFARHGPANDDGEARPGLSWVEWHQTADGLERRSARYIDGAEEQVAALMLPGTSGAEIAFAYDGAWSETVLITPDAPLPEALRLTLNIPNLGRTEQLFLIGAGQ
ncbi:MAG: type II secretion system minor pseudopilin GspJ [Pacificimonas sp.]|jgi:general secretion pathway protein J|nr:type II secretion system minor pseudopilin GspJ [Pacificimonas sp.]